MKLLKLPTALKVLVCILTLLALLYIPTPISTVSNGWKSVRFTNEVLKGLKSVVLWRTGASYRVSVEDLSSKQNRKLKRLLSES